MWQKFFILALGGALGTLARFGLAELVQKFAPGDFPLATMIVNVVGCLSFGIIFAIISQRAELNPHIQLFLLVGFMGAFTTFSTYAWEAGMLLRDVNLVHAFGHLAGHNLLGISAMLLGLLVGRWI